VSDCAESRGKTPRVERDRHPLWLTSFLGSPSPQTGGLCSLLRCARRVDRGQAWGPSVGLACGCVLAGGPRGLRLGALRGRVGVVSSARCAQAFVLRWCGVAALAGLTTSLFVWWSGRLTCAFDVAALVGLRRLAVQVVLSGVVLWIYGPRGSAGWVLLVDVRWWVRGPGLVGVKLSLDGVSFAQRTWPSSSRCPPRWSSRSPRTRLVPGRACRDAPHDYQVRTGTPRRAHRPGHEPSHTQSTSPDLSVQSPPPPATNEVLRDTPRPLTNRPASRTANAPTRSDERSSEHRTPPTPRNQRTERRTKS